MEQKTLNRARLMRMSWEIQKNSKGTRSKALSAAWAFFSNEKVLVKYLTRKLNRGVDVSARVVNQYSLFRA
jgi:hypothetical protein